MLLIKSAVGRTVVDVLFFLSLLIAPWWLSVIIGLIGLMTFDNYYEIIVGAFIIDVLYGKSFSIQGQAVGFMTTLLALILALLSGPIKKRLIFYQS